MGDNFCAIIGYMLTEATNDLLRDIDYISHQISAGDFSPEEMLERVGDETAVVEPKLNKLNDVLRSGASCIPHNDRVPLEEMVREVNTGMTESFSVGPGMVYYLFNDAYEFGLNEIGNLAARSADKVMGGLHGRR